MAPTCRARRRSGQLVRKILKLVPELKRLRLSSIDSIEADADLMRAIAEEERLMPHFHLSRAVGRRHDPQAHEAPPHARATRSRSATTVRRLRPDAAFGADLIAGFPTETEAMFENTLNAGRRGGPLLPARLSLQRAQAARRPRACRSSTRRVVKERAARLRAKGEAALAARLAALVGTTQTLLVEKHGMGRTRCFAPVQFDGDASAGTFVTRAHHRRDATASSWLTSQHERFRRSAAAADLLRAAEGRPVALDRGPERQHHRHLREEEARRATHRASWKRR